MRITSLNVVLVMGIGIGIGACTRPNPAYRGPADGAAPLDLADGGGMPDGDGSAPVDATDGGARDGVGDLPGDASLDGPLSCAVAMDCTTRVSPVPCTGGAWACTAGQCLLTCPSCTDADHDGYGVGTGCAGGDCDDTNPLIHATGQRACYSGPAGTAGRGVCRMGSQVCSNGEWTVCAGQVVPSIEACNGEDDDCDTMVDDNLPVLNCGTGACARSVPSCAAGVVGVCVPGAPAEHDVCDNGVDNDCDGQSDEECPANISACIHVAPDGDDAGDGSMGAPLATIPAAMTLAISPAAPSKTICVAGGAACVDRATYTLPDLFQMQNGISIYGNYRSDSWVPCPLDPTAPDPHVTLDLREMGGVRFPASVTTPTTLDGFVLQRASGGGIVTTSAVTVNGAKQVRLSNLVVSDTPSVTNSYGVNLINGGEALITHSYIAGGGGTGQSFGVHATGNSKPTVRENCSNINPTTGRCQADCMAPGLGIFGRTISMTGGASTAAHLETSPGALIETSTLCSLEATQAAGVRITGNALGTIVRGNFISATAGVDVSAGVWAEDCLEAAPWIVDNQVIEGDGGVRVVGVLSIGGCHPVIDSNQLISVTGDGTTSEADGVSCQANANGEASLCNVVRNKLIQGSDTFSPATSAGVACKERGCARVADNVILGNEGGVVIGLWMRNDGVTVERNRISGGCGRISASGVLADDGFSRLQNNVISGGGCISSLASSPLSIGVRVYNADDQDAEREMDIHSNTIDGGGNGSGGSCVSIGIEWGVGPETPPTTPKGIVRNNILRAGTCNPRYDFSEALPAADPRVFENNDLDPTGPTVLYLNEMTILVNNIALVNALPGAGGNISANPMFVSFPTDQHLMSGSACVGAGTLAGAPASDFDGKKRATAPARPTIGAYE